jgi:hypothetical protein
MFNVPGIDWLRANGKNLRVHGNRFIQIDLTENQGVGGERLHVWSDHVPLAQDYPTWIHDHVFGFHSRILAGTLIDVRYKTAAWVGKDADVLTYDVCQAMPRHGSDTALRGTGEQVVVEVMSAQALPAGRGYMIAPREFHASSYVGYAITRIKKTATVDGVLPRVLCPTGANPDNEFERYRYAPEALWAIVDMVLQFARKEKA